MNPYRLALSVGLVFFFMASAAYAGAAEEMMIQNSRPEHGLVYSENMDVDLSTPPAEASLVSQGTIRDAWALIVSIMPLVEDVGVNTTWVSPDGSVRAAYGYDYKLPGNDPGCGSTYSFDSRGVQFDALAGVSTDRHASTYLETQPLDMKNGIANYTLTTKGEYAGFDVTTTFWVKYIEHKHHLINHCSGEGEDSSCSTTCESAGSVVHEDRLPIPDSKSYNLYILEHNESLLIDHSFADSQQGRFKAKASPLMDGLQLSLGGSSFSFDMYNYHVVPAEFGMKKIRAVTKNEIQKEGAAGVFSNLEANHQKVGFYFTSGNVFPAKIKIFGHFDEYETLLEPRFTTETRLNLETSKKQYRVVDTIEVAAVFTDRNGAPLSQKEILFRYAGETEKALTDTYGRAVAAFTPVEGEDIMSARFIGDEEYGEAYDTTHFFVGRFIFINFLSIVAWIAVVYYVVLRGGKWAWNLFTKGSKNNGGLR